ncbi:MAG: glycosyltransferase family 4 protein [Candidatus Moranbacteria bacterium]|nr:glycosyltransferase family 4 protein [Candidatus Moranbacteria bacterium]
MKILFVSHTFPPIVGGVETQNYELSKWLGEKTEIEIVANKKRWMLPFFLLVYAPLRILFSTKKYDALLLGSGILGNVSWLIKKVTKKPVVIVTHGLDLTWKNKLYQKLWVKIFIPSADKLVAVGNETIGVGVARGIAEKKFVFIPNGVDTEKHLIDSSRAEIEKIVGKQLENKKILLTSGRLAKRKGVAWFINNVMPKLDQDFLYVIAGDGKDRQNIEQAISNNGLENRVVTLGYVTDEDRNKLWNACDLFVQPNIKVPGDMEGFGISVIEAGACRLPVLASDMEGLKDAIKDGKNGFLVESENAQAYVDKINELFANGSPREIFGESVRNFVIENYQWKHIAQIYLEEIEKTIQKSKISMTNVK